MGSRRTGNGDTGGAQRRKVARTTQQYTASPGVPSNETYSTNPGLTQMKWLFHRTTMQNLQRRKQFVLPLKFAGTRKHREPSPTSRLEP